MRQRHKNNSYTHQYYIRFPVSHVVEVLSAIVNQMSKFSSYTSLCTRKFLFVFKEFDLNERLLHKYPIGIMAPHYEVIDSNPSIILHAVHKVYEN